LIQNFLRPASSNVGEPVCDPEEFIIPEKTKAERRKFITNIKLINDKDCSSRLKYKLIRLLEGITKRLERRYKFYEIEISIPSGF